MKYFKKIIFAGVVLSIILLPALSFGAANITTVPNPPVSVSAACPLVGGTVTIGNIICKIGFFLNQILPVLLSLGVIYFVWGVVTYMISEDEEQKTKGKDKIIYGIIGLAVIVAMWGLVNMVISGFGLDASKMANINVVVDTTAQQSTSTGCFSTYQSKSTPIVSDVLTYATCMVSSSVIPLLFIIATAAFIWGVVQTVINPDEEEKREKGRQFMLWGVIALTVMVSMWGLVRLLGNTFNVPMDHIPTPKVDNP